MTKAEAIRSVLDQGITKPKEVAAEVKKQFGLVVTPGHVSSQKLADSKKGVAPKPAKPANRTTKYGESEALFVVKAAVDRIGGIEQTRAALDALQKLRA